MTGSSISILHIMSSYGGGISSFIRNKVKSIDSSKITIDVVSFNEVPEEFRNEIEGKNGRVFIVPNPKKEGFIKFARMYRNILEEHGPYYMIHSNLGGYRSFVFYLLSKSMGIKRFAVHAHSSDISIEKAPSLLTVIRTKIGQALNRYASTEMVSCGRNASEYYFGKRAIKRHRIMHIPNSIDLEKYLMDLNEEKRKKIKLADDIPLDKPIIGHVGRFDDNKNQEFQIEIIKKMVERNIDFFWIFIGEGKTRTAIERSIKDQNLTSFAKVLGRREDVDQLYQIMDTLVLTSYSEGLPTVCIESQAAGVPCVVSDTVTKEIDMQLGMVRFEPLKDVERWISAITELQKKPIPDKDVREKQLKKNKFTNPTSAELYEDFVFNRINHYEL